MGEKRSAALGTGAPRARPTYAAPNPSAGERRSWPAGAFSCPEEPMHEANLTRFGPKTFGHGHGSAATDSATFRAIPGPAKLVLHSGGLASALAWARSE